MVTAEWIARARLCNPCHVPDIGTPFSDLNQTALTWCDDVAILDPVEVVDAFGRCDIQLSLLAFDGDGDG